MTMTTGIFLLLLAAWIVSLIMCVSLASAAHAAGEMASDLKRAADALQAVAGSLELERLKSDARKELK